MIIVSSPGPSFMNNPFFSYLRDALRARGHEILGPTPRNVIKAQVLHLNFPDHMISQRYSYIRALFASISMLVLVVLHKVTGGKVIWMVHDVVPLSDTFPNLTALHMRMIRKAVDRYVFLSRSSKDAFERMYPQATKSHTLLAHPLFPTIAPCERTRARLRAQFGFTDHDYVVGILGDQKSYKSPDAIRFLPRRLSDGRHVIPLIVGKADGVNRPDYANILSGRRVVEINRRPTDEELEKYIGVVDVVFLPYSRGWNSGMLMLALSCMQNAICSNLPIFQEYEAEFGSDKVKTFDYRDAEHTVSAALNYQALLHKAHDQDDTIQYGYCFAKLAVDLEAIYAE